MMREATSPADIPTLRRQALAILLASDPTQKAQWALALPTRDEQHVGGKLDPDEVITLTEAEREALPGRPKRPSLVEA